MKGLNPQLKELFKTPKRKTYSLVGGTTMVVGILILFSLRPTFVKIADLNREIKDKQEFLDKLDKKLETINYLISQKQTVASELAYFEEDFPSEPKDGFLVANLAAIADKFNLDLMSVEFSEEEKVEEIMPELENTENIRVNSLDVRLEGSISDIQSYADYLETFPRIFDIQSISYSKAELSKYEGDLSAFKPILCNIKVNVFYWTESELEEGDTESVVGEL